MPSSINMALLFGSSLAVDIPSLNPTFCTSMRDEMSVNNVTQQLNIYSMCMDATTGFWMTDGLGGDGAVGIGKVVDGEYRNYNIQKASDSFAGSCSYQVVPASCFPCQFIIIDADPATTVERGVMMDGVECDHWQHTREVGGQPIGTMNWWVRPVDEHPDLVRNAYVSPDGSSVGARDFHANYTRSVAEGVVFDEKTYLPEGVECIQAGEAQDGPIFSFDDRLVNVADRFVHSAVTVV